MHLDTAKCFIDDTKGYKDAMWKEDKVLGTVSSKLDPDRLSPTLWRYQHLLYRRELPNGEFFDLKYHGGTITTPACLKWGKMEFTNDSIIVSNRYKKDFPLIYEIAKRPGYKKWVEDFLKEAYTIGGEMLFPKPEGESINQAKGMDKKTVFDRFDTTLECIKAFYDGKTDLFNGGLNRVLEAVYRSADFFQKFNDFKGYVDFFLLNDCVYEDYSVKRFLEYRGRPQNEKDYDLYIANQIEFLRKRNAMISKLDLVEWEIERTKS